MMPVCLGQGDGTREGERWRLSIRAGVKTDGTFSFDDIVPGEHWVAALQFGPGPDDVRRTEYPPSVTADGQGLRR